MAREGAQLFPRAIVLCAFAVGSRNLKAEDPPEIEFSTEWTKGDRYRIELVKKRTDTRGDKSSSARARTLYDVQVLDHNDQGFVIAWTQGETQLEGDQASDPGLKKLVALQKGLRLELQTDESGVPQKILNDEETSRFWQKLKMELSGKVEAEGLSKGVLKDFDEITNLDFARQSMLKAPQLFYFLCGAALVQGRSAEYEYQLPNPFGGEPFPCIGRILLKEVDPARAEAHLEWSQRLDPGRIKGILEETIARLSKKPSNEGPKAADVENFSMEDRASFTMDLRTGLPNTVDHTRTMVTGALKRVDRRRFKRLPAND